MVTELASPVNDATADIPLAFPLASFWSQHFAFTLHLMSLIGQMACSADKRALDFLFRCHETLARQSLGVFTQPCLALSCAPASRHYMALPRKRKSLPYFPAFFDIWHDCLILLLLCHAFATPSFQESNRFDTL